MDYFTGLRLNGLRADGELYVRLAQIHPDGANSFYRFTQKGENVGEFSFGFDCLPEEGGSKRYAFPVGPIHCLIEGPPIAADQGGRLHDKLRLDNKLNEGFYRVDESNLVKSLGLSSVFHYVFADSKVTLEFVSPHRNARDPAPLAPVRP